MAQTNTSKVRERDVTEWIFKRFNELTKPNITAQQREEILYRVFSMLEKCDKSWQCQLDILDVFGNIIKNKAEILFGCGNILDLVITMIENLENNKNTNNKDKEVNISTIHCKLCHLISIVGRTQLSVQHLNRILILLRDSSVNRKIILLSTLKDMTRHSPPFYHNHSLHKAPNKNNNSPPSPSPSPSTPSPSTPPHNTSNTQWIASPQKIISSRAKSIVSVFSDRWFQSQTESVAVAPKTNAKRRAKIKTKSKTKTKTKSKSRKKEKFNIESNTLLHIIHQLPLSSFAFLNRDIESESSIDVSMKYIKKWPYTNGFTFVGWILYHQLSPHIYNKNSWMTIFSMLTVSGYGIHISLCCKSGSIKIRLTYKNIMEERVMPKARLLASTWYFVAITHCQSRTAALRILRPSTAKNGLCKIYINGNKISSIDIQFLAISEKPRYCSIGRCSFPSSLNDNNTFASSSSSFCGQFGSIYFFGNPLSSTQINQLYSFGANYMIKPEIVKQSNPNWILNTFTNNNNSNKNNNNNTPISMETSASTIEIEIFQNLMMAFHPLATEISNKLCLNVGCSIYLHGKIHGDVEIFKTKDVRNIFHCSIGGLLSLFPLLTSSDCNDEIICLVFDILAQLLHFSISNQIQIQRSSAIPILGYLLQQMASKYITEKVLTSIHNFTSHLSWLQHEDIINSKCSGAGNEDCILFSHLPPSLSSSMLFNQLRANMDACHYDDNCLFNQSVNYLILNFKIWTDSNEKVENQLVQILTIWCKNEPKYMYQLISIDFLLTDILSHYSYKNRKKKKNIAWLWNIRQYYFNILIYLIQNNLIVDKNRHHSSSLQHIDLLLQMAVELTDPLQCSDMMEILVSLIHTNHNHNHHSPNSPNSNKLSQFLFSKKTDSHRKQENDLIINYLLKKNCIKLFGVLFREQCVFGGDFLQVCCLHLINKLNLCVCGEEKEEEKEELIVSLVSAFIEKEKEIPLVTYHSFLELILALPPGSIGVKHGTEFYVKKHELIQSKHYIGHLQSSLIKYPQAFIQLLRCNNSKIMKSVLQDFVSLLAASRHCKENASAIVASRGFQEPFIKLIDFCNINLQSGTDSLSWYGETCLDLLLQYSLLYDNRGWKILRDTFRIMRYYCQHSKISLIYCVISQCYLFIRILKRLSSLIHQHQHQHQHLPKTDTDLDADPDAFDTNIVIVNLVRCLELIEIIIYELPPGLFSYKIDDWVLMEDEEKEKEENEEKEDELEDELEDEEEEEEKQEIESCVMDEIWILLCSSILSVMESIPKINLSPCLFSDTISSPPLKSGSPFRVLLRLLLSCLERNIESEISMASIQSLIQKALQFLTCQQHPSIKYIASLSFVVRRFHGQEINNQFIIFLIKSLHDIYDICKNSKSKHHLLKLIQFVIASREPISFIPIEMFNVLNDKNVYLTCKINNGEMFASIIDQAKNDKLTHLAIPITSKLLSLSPAVSSVKSGDMGFKLNTLRLQFTANNVLQNKRIEMMIMERVDSDIKATMKFIANLNFINFEKGNVEVLESNAIRKLLERMDNRQRNYLEYYRHEMLFKQEDKLNKYAYKEANRKVFSLNQSDEKLKRGKMYWLECKAHIYCQGSVWFDYNQEKRKRFWQIDNWENKHRMRLKLIEYKGGLVKTRSAGDSHSHSHSNTNNANTNMRNLTQSIANLDEWGITFTQTNEEQQEEQEEDNDADYEEKKEDGWDYCNTIATKEDYYINELEDVIIYECECVLLITPIGNYEGEIKITRSYFQFLCNKSREKYERITSDTYENGDSCHIYSLPALNQIRLDESGDRYISLEKIHAIFRRRYQLQHSALEIFLLDGKSYFFEIGSKEKRNEILKTLFSHRELKSSMVSVNKLFSRKAPDIMRLCNICDRWRKHEISNFDYLILLNTISGRSYNDVNQYPIFPWILSDYVSPELDLSNPAVFRDLSKPMGALNPDRLKTIIKKFRGLLQDTSVPAFHYGSHYSNGAIVISYLLRLEPFSSLHIELQGGKFDFPDRLFSSLQQSWDAVISSLTTFKELIPEFFYLPHMLKNINCYDLGRRQNGESVDDVKLPPWASSADDFIRKHRNALESPYVSAHLHNWIDLIWGYKQRGKPAENANNLFYHLTYEGAVSLDEMEDEILKRAMKEQIANFGQTPIQLFHKPHIERDPQINIVPYAWKIGNKYQKIPCLHEVIVNKQTAIQKLLILNTNKHKDYDYNVLVTISISGCPLGHTLYVEHSHSGKADISSFKIKIPSVIRDLYTYRTPPPQYDTPSFVLFEHSHISKYHPSSLTKASCACIAYNNNIVYVGNNWDSSLRVYRLQYTTNTNETNDHQKKGNSKKKPHLGQIKWRLIQSFISHKSRISCIDTDGMHLASGSDDCTVVIWQINNKNKHKNMDYFTFDLLVNSSNNNSNNNNDNNNKDDVLLNDNNNNIGLISNSKCVLRGHQSAIVAIALNSELDICVSCSSQGLILIHTVQHGEYRHSLYLSADICGRGTLLNNLQFKHIPDGGRQYPSQVRREKVEPHPDVKYNPFDVTSSHDINENGSDMDLSDDDDDDDDIHNNIIINNWGERCPIDIVCISPNGVIVFLSKTCNMIFSCNINGMNWNSLKVTDNLTSIDIDKSGKLLLTAGQCGIAKIRLIHKLSRNVYKFMPVGDSITIAKFDHKNNRVYICTESGNLHLFALPHLTRIRSIIDTIT